jgi:hypothetical protein
MGAWKVTGTPLVTSPELNARLSAVRVWITRSSLITVMVAPGLTVKCAGRKAKFWIVTVIADAGVTDVDIVAGDVFVLLLPQALTNNNVTMVASAATRR